MEVKELIDQYKALKETSETLQVQLDAMETPTDGMEASLEELDVMRREISQVQEKMKICKGEMYKELLEGDEEKAKLAEQRSNLQAQIDAMEADEFATPEELDQMRREVAILDSKLKDRDELLNLIEKELGISKEEILKETSKLKEERIKRQQVAEKLVKEMEEEIKDSTGKKAKQGHIEIAQEPAVEKPMTKEVDIYKPREVAVQQEKQVVAPETKEVAIPKEEEKNTNLPIKSGLFIYNQTLQASNKIRGIHNIPILGRFFGKKKTEQSIMDSLDTLSEQEFGTLIDYLDERTVRELKVNDLYLRVVEKKLAQVVATKNHELKLTEQTAAKEIAAIEAEVAKIQLDLKKEGLTDTEVVTYNKQLKQFGVALLALEGKRNACREQQAANYDAQTRLNRARVGKSGQMTNVRGSVFATRNPDNREEIQQLASIEQEKLKAQQKGDFLEAHKQQKAMTELMEKNTAERVVFQWKGKPVMVISAGKFKSERTGEVTVTSDKKDMTKSMALLAMAGIGTAATVEQLYEYYTTVNFDAEKVTEASKKMQETMGNFTNSINEENLKKAVMGLNQPLSDINAHGEYLNLADSNFKFTEGYHAADLAHHENMQALTRHVVQEQEELMNMINNGVAKEEVMKKILQVDNSLWAEFGQQYGATAGNIVADQAAVSKLPYEAQTFLANLTQNSVDGRIAMNSSYIHVLDAIQKAKEMGIIEPAKAVQPDFISSLITGGAITGKYAHEIAQNRQHNIQTAKPKINTQEHEKNQGEER